MLLRFCLTKYNWKCKARILFIFKLHCLVLIAGYNSNIFQGCKISVFVRGAILRALFLLSTTCWELLQDRMQHLEHKSDNWFLSPRIELNLCLFFHFFSFPFVFFQQEILAGRIVQMCCHTISLCLCGVSGHVCLVVNVACKWGATNKNYQQLQALYDELADSKGLRILAFPCNQFGGQVSISALSWPSDSSHTHTHV